MRITRRNKTIAFFIVLGSLLVAVAVVLNVTWILHWRSVVPVVIGIILFALIIAGMILNTIFLVREVRRNEQQDSFLNAVTHELRTPLASLRMHIETLQSRSMSDEKKQDFYRLMREDTERLIVTVDQVLRAAEFKHRDQRDWAPVQLGQLVAECVNEARRRYHLEPPQLEFKSRSHDEAMTTIMGDAEEMRVAVTNLIDNAVKYSPDGPKITVTVQALGNDVTLSVVDQGLGIPPADLKRVFKRFYRGTRHRTRAKGTGLGLFIVDTITRKHRGRVSAESEGEGRGTTMTLRLPRLAER
jgi:two-component system, OmpR family, sensor histidine kinase SenX3